MILTWEIFFDFYDIAARDCLLFEGEFQVLIRQKEKEKRF